MSKQKKSRVAEYIKHQVEFLMSEGRTQASIGADAGFDQPNMIAMLKTGQTKLAIKRIPALAKALRVDPRFLLEMCLAEYMPEEHQAILEIMQQPLRITPNELNIIRIIRSINENDPHIPESEDSEAYRALRALVKSIPQDEAKDSTTAQV